MVAGFFVVVWLLDSGREHLVSNFYIDESKHARLTCVWFFCLVFCGFEQSRLMETADVCFVVFVECLCDKL